MSDESREIAELRDQVRRLTHRLAQARHRLGLDQTLQLAPERETTSLAASSPTSRRKLLKVAGVTVAAVGGVALAGNQSPVAHAATGGTLIQDETNNADAPTVIVPSKGSYPETLLGVENPDSNPNDDVTGIYAHVNSGYAIVTASDTGVDFYANGSGRFQQEPYVSGIPTTGTYSAGEMILDLNGSIYLCVSSGSPGTWRAVALADGVYPGGAISLYSPPFRLYDSRTHDGPLIGNTFRDIFFDHVAGMVGNLTVTNTTSSGYLVIYPAGTATPSSSTVNYLKGQTNANSFIVAVGVNGYVRVHNFGGGNADFVLDATGFITN